MISRPPLGTLRTIGLGKATCCRIVDVATLDLLPVHQLSQGLLRETSMSSMERGMIPRERSLDPKQDCANIAH
jgi:hypothetical protein